MEQDFAWKWAVNGVAGVVEKVTQLGLDLYLEYNHETNTKVAAKYLHTGFNILRAIVAMMPEDGKNGYVYQGGAGTGSQFG